MVAAKKSVSVKLVRAISDVATHGSRFKMEAFTWRENATLRLTSKLVYRR